MKPTFTSEAYNPDRLHAGDHPIRTLDVTIVSGQNLKRGAVLGVITASGKYTLSASAAVDGSEDPVAILAEDCDASGGDKTAVVYVAGDFNADRLTLGDGHTVDSVRSALLARSIYIVDPVAATDAS